MAVEDVWVLVAGSAGWGFQMRVHSLLAHGAKAIKYFAFGPEWAFPGNCWGDDVATYASQMITAHTMAADAEALLWPGVKRRSDVAILYPRSSQVWDLWETAPPGSGRFPKGLVDGGNKYVDGETMDYFVDADFIYLSLTLGWGVDAFWIDEQSLTAEGLAPFKVVIVTEPCVPAAAQKALLAWVHERGGSVITTMGAASFDEYNTPSSVLIDGLGIQRKAGLAAKPTTLPEGKLWTNVSGTGILPNGLNVTAWGPVEQLSVGPSSSVLAEFTNGLPALLHANAGAGQAWHFPWHPGLSVARTENLKFSLKIYGQQNRLSPGIGWLLRNSSLAAGASPAVDVSAALDSTPLYRNGTYVELPVLDSAEGTLVSVLNWRNTTGATFPLSVAVDFKVASVESALVGALPFTQAAGGGRVSIVLPSLPNVSDFISIRRHGSSRPQGIKSDDDPYSAVPQPYEWMHGARPSLPAVAASPDPLVRHTWDSTVNSSTLQQAAVSSAITVHADPPSSFEGLASLTDPSGNVDVLVKAPGWLRLDYGVERPAWLEGVSAQLRASGQARLLQAAISEYDQPFKSAPVRMNFSDGSGAFRLETPKRSHHDPSGRLYEGVRFA